MTTLTKPAQVPSPRSRPKLPWFCGDVPGIAAVLRKEAAAYPDGDCVKAVMMIEAIQEHPGLSGAVRARLTGAVIAAVQLVRGWDAPLAVDEQPVAGLPVDPDPRPTVPEPAPASATAGSEPAPACDAPPGAQLVGEAAADRAEALQAVEAGDVPAVAWRLTQARRGRPDGECVEAIALLERVCDEATPITPAARNRRTLTVLAAVRLARGWDA